MSDQPPTPTTVVVGGGIAGLAAAWFLAEAGYEVTLLEGSPQVGGKLRLGSVAGLTVDVGAEAMLARRPEGVALASALGLPITNPSTTASRVWSRDALRPLPRTLMGVPLDPAGLAASGLLSAAGLHRALHEPVVPVPADDVTVADLVGSRLGPEVVERLVEPLLGGVYAGHAALLSARATVPQLVALLDRGSTLTQAAAALPSSDAPVFAGIPGGMGRLPLALAGSGRFRVETGAVVRELAPLPGGRADPGGRAAPGGRAQSRPRWRVAVGPAGGTGLDWRTVGPTLRQSRPLPPATAPHHTLDADHVVLATPAAATSRLLADVAPAAAAELAAMEYASMAIVTLAFRASDVVGLEGSGFLVPPVDGRTIKASTFSFHKWDWVRDLDPDIRVLRTSIGRHREEAALQVDDDELVRASLLDLAAATGLAATPVDTHVQRWGGALPQYAVGHLDRVARVRAALPAGVVVAGAAYDGVGIPAVIASARRAVDDLRAGESST